MRKSATLGDIMNKRALCLLMIAAVSSAMSIAAYADDASELNDCIAKQGSSNASINQCMSNIFVERDQTLNSTYQQAMQIAKTDDANSSTANSSANQSGLKAAEKAWLAYRDAECTAEGATMDGGTGTGGVIIGCKTRMTEARTAEINSQYLTNPMTGGSN
jgi:uncharacterized protein YecT (DUF1311 family)